MKKILFIVAIILFVMSLTACGKEEKEKTERFFSIEYQQEAAIDLPCQAVCGANGAWILAAVKGTPVYFYNRETLSTFPVDWNMNGGEYITAMAAREENLYLVVSNGSSVQVRRGHEGRAWENIAAFSNEDVEGISSFWVDERENFYFGAGDEILIADRENQQKRIALSGQERTVFWEESGKVRCLTSNQESLSMLDISGAEPIKEWSLAYPCTYNLLMIDNSDSEVWLIADDSLLCVNTDSGEILSETDLLKCGISTMDIFCGAFADGDAEDEKLFLYGKSVGDRLVAYQLGELSGEEVSARQEIVYGTLAVNGAIMNQIVEFNKRNRDYYVTMRVYGNGDFESGRMQMQAALSSGNGPDIVNTFFMDNCEQYAQDGYFENLTPYLQSAVKNGDDRYGEIMWKIMEPYYVDGKAYILMPHFTLSGLMISSEDTEGMENWNVDEMFALIEKNAGQKNIFTNSAAEQVLSLAVRGMQRDFIDHAAKTCNFDGEEFIQLLEYCRLYGRESGQGGTTSMGDMAQRTLFLDMTFSSHIEYLLTKASYGQGIEVYGYPTVGGQEYIVNPSMDACALSAQSNNREGAWLFMSTLLDPAYQGAEGLGFPICRDAYDIMWENAGDETFRIQGDEYHVVTEDKELFDRILENGVFQSGALDKDILNIIQEEAATCFAGDKSAREAACIIQNRVQLMLDE